MSLTHSHEDGLWKLSWEGDGGLFPEAGRTLDFPLLSSLDCSTDLSNCCSLEGSLQREAETPGFSRDLDAESVTTVICRIYAICAMVTL